MSDISLTNNSLALRYLRASGSSFNPASIPNLIIWYDPADALTSGGSTPSDNGVIASLPARGGSWNYTLDTINGTVRYLESGGPGGGPCLVNDGAAGIRREGLSETPGNDFTIITASYKIPNQNTQYWHWAMAGSSLGGDEDLSFYMDNGEAMNFRADNGSVSPDMGSIDPDGSWRLYSGYVQSSSTANSSVIRRGYPSIDGDFLVNGTYTISTIERICLGGRTSQGADGCRVGPMLIYNRVLTSQELEQVTEWFNKTYFNWETKANYYAVADSGGVTVSGSDVTGWNNLVPGGPDPGYNEGSPTTYPTFSTTNFSGKGEIDLLVSGKEPLYFPDNTFGSLSGIWVGTTIRFGPGSETSNRPIIGGGSQFAAALSSGELAIFDGSYKSISGVNVPIDADITIIWQLDQASSCEVFLNGDSIGTISLDGNVGSDNLNLTLGGFNKVNSVNVSIRALAFGKEPLTNQERKSLQSWLNSQL